MRKSGTAAIMALGILSHSFLSTIDASASPWVLAQAAAAPSRAGVSPAAGVPQSSPTMSSPTIVAPAEKSALSIPACSVRYLEAKVTGKLQGRKWVDFRRDECGRREVTAVFPTAIAPKYASEKDLDKARTKTCADQFTANKPTNANGGLVWVEKDGGYYAECVIRLKG